MSLGVALHDLLLRHQSLESNDRTFTFLTVNSLTGPDDYRRITPGTESEWLSGFDADQILESARDRMVAPGSIEITEFSRDVISAYVADLPAQDQLKLHCQSLVAEGRHIDAANAILKTRQVAPRVIPLAENLRYIDWLRTITGYAPGDLMQIKRRIDHRTPERRATFQMTHRLDGKVLPVQIEFLLLDEKNTVMEVTLPENTTVGTGVLKKIYQDGMKKLVDQKSGAPLPNLVFAGSRELGEELEGLLHRDAVSGDRAEKIGATFMGTPALERPLRWHVSAQTALARVQAFRDASAGLLSPSSVNPSIWEEKFQPGMSTQIPPWSDPSTAVYVGIGVENRVDGDHGDLSQPQSRVRTAVKRLLGPNGVGVCTLAVIGFAFGMGFGMATAGPRRVA